MTWKRATAFGVIGLGVGVVVTLTTNSAIFGVISIVVADVLFGFFLSPKRGGA